MKDFPGDGKAIGGDHTLALLREGYPFIMRRCRLLGSDVFDTRLMLQPTTCITGREAAEIFYDETRMRRAGGLPRRVRKTLTGDGAVQSLDGERHRARKALLLSIAMDDAIGLEALVEDEWRRARAKWSPGKAVVLIEEARRVLCRAACRWVGVPVSEEELPRLAESLDALIRGPGAVGLRHLRARRARRETERRFESLVRERRGERAQGEPQDAVDRIAMHVEPDGRPLTEHAAAVELLNLLRPTVALSIYVAFAAHALHRHPESAPRGGDDAALERFAHEVRRFYPFFPFAAGRAAGPFEWRGHRFPGGRRVLLDLYGTCRDERLWTHPETFDPSRFEGRVIDPYTLIPQGGGEHAVHHRCAGELATVRVLCASLRFLIDGVEYAVPPQDLQIDLARIPTQPASGFVIVAK